jgi:single-stranded DNA-binding protein
VYLNQLSIAGQIIKGPNYMLRRNGKLHQTEFCLLQQGSHRTHRRLIIWCRAYQQAALNLKKYLQKKDWVCVQGFLYTRKWGQHGRFHFYRKDGSPVEFFERTEIYAEQVDLLDRPWHDDKVKISRDEYRRYRELMESHSKWQVPDGRKQELLTNEQIADLLAEEEPGSE